MATPLVNLNVASVLFSRGDSFRVRLEFIGSNGDTKSGHSAKWWELYWPGSGYVQCNHGAIGNNGRSEPFTYDWSKALEKAREKLGKGYEYVWGTETSAPKPTAHMTVKLTGPFALIREIRKAGAGLYKTFDKAGDYLLDLDEDGRDQVLAADPMVCLS